MSDFASVGMLQGYLKVLTDRQQMIASNMANIDTPGYHTKDLNFQAAIRRVMPVLQVSKQISRPSLPIGVANVRADRPRSIVWFSSAYRLIL